jgi:hypothetical protein
MWNTKMKKHESDLENQSLLSRLACLWADEPYLIPLITLIESFPVETSMRLRQLFCTEKHFRTRSHVVVHWAASTESSASLIRSSRFHEQNTINSITAKIVLHKTINSHLT